MRLASAPLAALTALLILAGSSLATPTPEVARKAQKWTVKVETFRKDGNYGSGVCAGHYVWTAAHLFQESCTNAKVRTSTGVHAEAKIVARCREVDLAVLELPEGVAIDGPAWCAKTAGVGERLYTAGCPGGFEFTVTSGIVSAVDRRIQGWKVLDQTDAPCNRGLSGGGVYLQDSGHLVGLFVAMGNNVTGFYVPVRAMRQFASDSGLSRAMPGCACSPCRCPACKCKSP